MKIVTAAEMREIDRITSQRYGVPSLTLMENAGAAVAEFLLREYPQAQCFGVICGKGNNGGDGFVAARKLHEAGKQVKVLLLADPGDLKGDAAEMYKKLPLTAVIARNEEELNSESAREVFAAEVLVDAILGTGFKPPVNGIQAAAIRALNALPARAVCAVDIPSGASADEPFEPNPELVAKCGGIVTFTAPKPVHLFNRFACLKTVVAQIGTPREAVTSKLAMEVITPDDIGTVLLPREPDAHKGDFGHVLIVGGSVGKAGAPAMAGMAALRAGAGLVTVAVPRSIQPTVAGFMPELMTEALEETEVGTISMRALEYGRMDKLMEGKSVVAIGPGISRHPESAEFVRTLVAECDLPVVLDADGLNAFEGCASKLDGSKRLLVVTPHPGEMARLTNSSARDIQKDRVGVARNFAREHKCVVVLKGWRTLIALPEGMVWVNPTGNPGMASGGTGDILTGLVAGLMGQHLSEKERASIAAVYLHGLAGDLARDELEEHVMTATDLLRCLPAAFRVARERARDKFVRVSG
ncbi:MAG TPA: NAD(P)H-hydrate dehydratase [Terriglobales bacterium]|nr:NAD(P)H-hydrate dehydratase [Terriglobales bacterium]